MENTYSIIIIKKDNKYLNVYNEKWGMYLFPYMKGNNIEKIKEKYNTNNVKLLFDKTHDKFSIPNNTLKTYHHYFYEVNTQIDGEYFTLEELLKDEKIKENNSDIINFIKEYYE